MEPIQTLPVYDMAPWDHFIGAKEKGRAYGEI